MKKVLSLVLMLCLAFTFVACGTSETKDDLVGIPSMFDNIAAEAAKWVYPTDQEGTAADKAVELPAGTYKVGVCIYKFDDTFMTGYREEIEKYFKSLETDDVKFEITVADGKNDMAEQSSQIDTFIADKVNVLIVNLVQSSSAGDITAKAKAAGIPIVYINREPKGDDTQAWDFEGKVCYVGADARQSGTIQGEIVANLADKGDIDGDGVTRYITLVGDAENPDAQYRTIFSIKALDDAGVNSMRLFEQRGDWDRAKGQELASSAISQFGDKIDVIFANNDDMALGAIEACKAAGLVVGTDIYIVGVDATDAARDALAAGDLTGTVQNDHVNQAHTAVNAALVAIKGDALMKYYMVDYLPVTE